MLVFSHKITLRARVLECDKASHSCKKLINHVQIIKQLSFLLVSLHVSSLRVIDTPRQQMGSQWWYIPIHRLKHGSKEQSTKAITLIVSYNLLIAYVV